MKLRLSIVLAISALYAQASEQNGKFAVGREYYAAAEFRKAAALFQTFCNTNSDAEACYWTGLSYERLADVMIPFGCRIDENAHQYFSRAMRLAPGVPGYRDALFDFLLNTADCSRTALREAESILSAISESDPTTVK